MSTDRGRLVLGQQVQNHRYDHDISIEAAAKSGGIGHMTWRKIERGEGVQERSYTGVDRAFGWNIGHTLACLRNDQALSEPTPPGSRGSSLSLLKQETLGADRAPPEVPSETNPERESNPFVVVLSNLEYLSLPQLQAVELKAGQIQGDREDRLGRVERTVNAASQLGQNTNVSFDFNSKYLFETTKQVAKEYEDAFRNYINTVSELEGIRAELAQLSEGPLPSPDQINELQARAERVFINRREAIRDMSDVQVNAIGDLLENERDVME